MTDEEALKEIDRQEKRFAAAKCGRGLQHWQKTLKDVKRVFAALGGIDWNGEAIRRDTVDLARTARDFPPDEAAHAGKLPCAHA